MTKFLTFTIECPTIPNCDQCSSANECKTCTKGFYWDGKDCTSTSIPELVIKTLACSTIDHCAACDKSDKCKECENGFFWDGNQCTGIFFFVILVLINDLRLSNYTSLSLLCGFRLV